MRSRRTFTACGGRTGSHGRNPGALPEPTTQYPVKLGIVQSGRTPLKVLYQFQFPGGEVVSVPGEHAFEVAPP
ncbi:MAG: hypothetical protein H0W54_07450 [Rubrobacter sp.]|nr:hypothetical protein [Rubrobacter sp.]